MKSQEPLREVGGVLCFEEERNKGTVSVFRKIYQLLPVLGIELLVISVGKTNSESDKNLLFCEIKGLNAPGHPTPDGFIVLQGSQAV